MYVVIDLNGWDDVITGVYGPFKDSHEAQAWIDQYHDGEGFTVEQVNTVPE